MSSPLPVTEREAAALDRLLDAYTITETTDPGIEDLRRVRDKVRRLPQDHTVYEQAAEVAARTRAFLREVGRGVVHQLPSGEARHYDTAGGHVNADDAVFQAKRAGLVRLGGVVTDGPYKHPRSRPRAWQLTRAGEVTAYAEPELAPESDGGR